MLCAPSRENFKEDVDGGLLQRPPLLLDQETNIPEGAGMHERFGNSVSACTRYDLGQGNGAAERGWVGEDVESIESTGPVERH